VSGALDGGALAAAALAAHGVREIFTLNGGHVWPVYDGCAKAGIRVVDTRHEQTAAFAAEAMAKLTRRPGVAVLTAGPGVTNGVSAVTTAWFGGSPLVVIGGRSPQATWGMGDLQELDHVPILAPVTKMARTATATAEIAPLVAEALRVAATPHRGPAFVEVPMDVFFGTAPLALPESGPPEPVAADPDEVARAADLLARAERPALFAGGDVWWAGAWEELVACAEWLRLPVFTNGQGRGCIPADHELAFSRARRALREADVVAVVGTPLDFRLGYGNFGDAAVIHVADVPERLAAHRPLAAAPAGDLRAILAAFAAHSGPRADHEPWIARLRELEAAARADERALLESAAEPIHPARVYGELRRRLDRDAVVIGDGGDFVSYAGKYIDSYRPGCWLDPGPYGCLGTGPGYAMAARIAHPDRQVVALLGDGAFGFSGIDFESLARHRLPVVAVVGNNGIWGLEKHPQTKLYGEAIAADLAPGIRYDLVVEALGGAGETVERPDAIGPALDRAFAAGVPYLVNVLTDPAVAYPRSTALG
jgi:acetolactate synthase-1/2/3 large subunit